MVGGALIRTGGGRVSRTLSIACAAEKEPLLALIEEEFNAAGHRDDNGTDLVLDCRYVDDARLLGSGIFYESDYFIPPSAASLLTLPELWDNDAPRLRFTSFASSPVVLAMTGQLYDILAGRARALAPRRPTAVGWHSLVGDGEQLRLMHAHGTTADGLAVLAAEWMWASDGREQAVVDVEGPARQLVSALEDRVVEYAPDDRAVLRRFRSAGADVVIAQEQAVLAAFADPEAGGVVIAYPAEGTVWVDQVLCSLRRGDMHRSRDLAHEVLSAHLLSPQTAVRLRADGLHPVGQVMGTRSDSELLLAAQPAGGRGSVRIANPGAPPMVFPRYRTVRTISEAWADVAKAADMCLILDISQSMAGTKLAAACDGVRGFCRRPRSTATAIGLITFNNTATVVVPVSLASTSVHAIESALRHVHEAGRTALLDAVVTGVAELERVAEPGRTRAIVLLTDGEDNNSRATFAGTQAVLAAAGITAFAIAYGDGADLAALQRLAGSGGLAVSASVRDIDEIYEALSAHF
jgi:uncharacterized protein YegL